MFPTAQTGSHPVHDELQDALQHVVTALNQKWEDAPLRVSSTRSPSKSGAERAFRLEGPDDMSLRIRFAVYPLGDGTHELYVDLEEGPTCRFTYDATGTRSETETERIRLGRKVTTVLLREIEPRLGRTSGEPLSEGDSPASDHRLVLNRKGGIHRMSDGALDALGYAPEESVDPNFFTHVHGQNLRRVMRDLAQMLNRDMQRARWILRLQTGSGRWRWYRADVINRLDSDGTIQIYLLPLEDRREAA